MVEINAFSLEFTQPTFETKKKKRNKRQFKIKTLFQKYNIFTLQFHFEHCFFLFSDHILIHQSPYLCFEKGIIKNKF